MSEPNYDILDRQQLPLEGAIRHIEDLAQLRSLLETWIDRAANAVWNFKRDDDGSFWTNSDAPRAGTTAPHITSTARAYVALQNAHRARGEDATPRAKQWVDCFWLF